MWAGDEPPGEQRAGRVPQEDDHGTAQADPDLFASLPDAVYRLDPGGRFTYLNEAAETLLERRAGELLGRDIRDAFPGTRGSALDEGYRQVLADGRPRDF